MEFPKFILEADQSKVQDIVKTASRDGLHVGHSYVTEDGTVEEVAVQLPSRGEDLCVPGGSPGVRDLSIVRRGSVAPFSYDVEVWTDLGELFVQVCVPY